jgi:hypothetical protein
MTAKRTSGGRPAGVPAMAPDSGNHLVITAGPVTERELEGWSRLPCC